MPKISKYLFYFLVFSLPLVAAFQPTFSLAFSQKIFLSGVLFLILLCWLIEIFATGQIKVKKTKSFFALIAFLVFSAISLAFSGAPFQSFFGDPGQSDSLLGIIIFGLAFFFALNLLENESEVRLVFKIFLSSATIVSIAFLVQYFLGKFIYMPIGSFQAQALLFGFALLSALFFLSEPIFSKKLSSKIFVALTSISFIILFVSILLINFNFAWFLVAIGSLILLWQALNEKSLQLSKDKKENQTAEDAQIQGESIREESTSSVFLKNFKIILPLIIFIVSACLFLIQPQLGKPFTPEVFPSYSLSFQISKNTLLESPKNFLFGSGPASFPYQFSLYKGTIFNGTQFQLIAFDQSACAILTLLTCLGFLALLALICLFIFSLVPAFKTGSKVLMIVVPFILLFFFYRINFALTTFAFIFLGLSQINGNDRQKIAKPIKLEKLPPQQSFGLLIILAALMIGSVFGIYKIYQQCQAELIYQKAVQQYNDGQIKVDEAIAQTEMAVKNFQRDQYLRDLSKLYLLKADQVYQEQVDLTQPMPQDLQTQLENYIGKAQSAAGLACQVNPRNPQNFENYGSVNEQLLFLVSGTGDLAIEAYQKASQLDPQNYNYHLDLERVYQILGNQEKAQEEYQKAIELNPKLANSASPESGSESSSEASQ